MTKHTTRSIPITLFIFVFIAFSAAGFAVQPPQETIDITDQSTLPDVLTAAALNNPGLKAAFQQWQAALQRAPQVRALPNPQLTYGYFIRKIETRVGPQQQKIGIKQMFPWFGKLKLKGNAAAEAAAAARQLYENKKTALFYNVKETYYDYFYAVQRKKILNENVQLLTYLEEVVRAKYRTGAAPYSSLVRIQVELDKLRDRTRSAAEILRPLKARLNAALNRPAAAPLPFPDDIPTDTPQLSLDTLTQSLKTNNPALKAGDAFAAKERFGIKLAKKNSYPDFTIGLDYLFTGPTDMPGVPDSGKDPIAAMVSLRLPVWSGKNKASVNEAAARYQAALDRRQENENTLLSRLEMAYFKYNDAGRKMKLYRDSLLPRAKEAREVTRSAFEAGKADFMNFIDAQRTLLAFQLEFQQARTQAAQRLAELEMLAAKRLN